MDYSDDVIVIEDSPPSTPITQTSNRRQKHSYQPQNHEFPVAEQAMAWSRNTTRFIKQSMNTAQQLPVQKKPPQYGAQPKNGYQPSYSFHNENNFGNQMLLNNIRHNFWMKVRLEEIPDKGEVISQYYIDDNQTPIKITQTEPEFIDIDTFANQIQKTNETLNSPSDNKKRKTPLFLKRNTVNNNMKLDQQNNTSLISSDNSDVIFLGEYPNVSKSESIEIKVKTEPVNIENTDTYLKSFGKGRRKKKTLIPVRRNPKRQVQMDKDIFRMIENVILESDKQERQLKKNGFKNKFTKTAIKQIKRSPRNNTLANSGAVYSPPSPLTKAHIRDWPIEGMHERPEYDPVTGKLKPFDSSILDISKKYIKTETNQNDQMSNSQFLAEDLENKKTFPELCHEMLHHVLSYIATVKILEKEENGTENSGKTEFLEILDLTSNNDRIENKICDILHTIVENITKETENISTPLMELLKNTVLLYCLTNNVDIQDVGTYISNLKPEDVIKLSNEQFKLLSPE